MLVCPIERQETTTNERLGLSTARPLPLLLLALLFQIIVELLQLFLLFLWVARGIARFGGRP